MVVLGAFRAATCFSQSNARPVHSLLRRTPALVQRQIQVDALVRLCALVHRVALWRHWSRLRATVLSCMRGPIVDDRVLFREDVIILLAESC